MPVTTWPPPGCSGQWPPAPTCGVSINADPAMDYGAGTDLSSARATTAAAAFNPGTGPFTLEVWTQRLAGFLGNTPAFTNISITSDGANNAVRWGIHSGAGTMEIFIGDGGVLSDIHSPTIGTTLWPSADGTWHQLAVTCTGPGGTVTWYFDGKIIGTNPATAYTLGGAVSGILGGFFVATSNYNACMAQLSAYHKVLTPTQIANHYAAMGLGPTTTYPATVIADGPISYWKMNEVATPLADSSGNSHSAAIVGPMGFSSTTGPVAPVPNIGAWPPPTPFGNWPT